MLRPMAAAATLGVILSAVISYVVTRTTWAGRKVLDLVAWGPWAVPGLVITALFSFMTAWSEYIVAAQVMQDEDMFTLPLGIKSFQASMSTEWGLYAAASILACASLSRAAGTLAASGGAAVSARCTTPAGSDGSAPGQTFFWSVSSSPGNRDFSRHMPPSHGLQRTRPSRCGCNPRLLWAGSLSLGR